MEYNNDTAFIHDNRPVEIVFDFKMTVNLDSIILINDACFGALEAGLSYRDENNVWKEVVWDEKNILPVKVSHSNPAVTVFFLNNADYLDSDNRKLAANAVKLNFIKFNDPTWFQMNEIIFTGLYDKQQIIPISRISSDLSCQEFFFEKNVSMDQIRIFKPVARDYSLFDSPVNILYKSLPDDSWKFLAGRGALTCQEPDVFLIPQAQYQHLRYSCLLIPPAVTLISDFHFSEQVILFRGFLRH